VFHIFNRGEALKEPLINRLDVQDLWSLERPLDELIEHVSKQVSNQFAFVA